MVLCTLRRSTLGASAYVVCVYIPDRPFHKLYSFVIRRSTSLYNTKFVNRRFRGFKTVKRSRSGSHALAIVLHVRTYVCLYVD